MKKLLEFRPWYQIKSGDRLWVEEDDDGKRHFVGVVRGKLHTVDISKIDEFTSAIQGHLEHLNAVRAALKERGVPTAAPRPTPAIPATPRPSPSTGYGRPRSNGKFGSLEELEEFVIRNYKDTDGRKINSMGALAGKAGVSQSSISRIIKENKAEP